MIRLVITSVEDRQSIASVSNRLVEELSLVDGDRRHSKDSVPLLHYLIQDVPIAGGIHKHGVNIVQMGTSQLIIGRPIQNGGRV